MIVALKLARAPSYGLFAAALLLLLLLFSRSATTEDRHRHSGASVALAGEPTRRLPPLSGAMGACDGQDCMREFDTCWFDGIVEYCPQATLHLLRHARHENPCYNQVFWHCVTKFGNRLHPPLFGSS